MCTNNKCCYLSFIILYFMLLCFYYSIFLSCHNVVYNKCLSGISSFSSYFIYFFFTLKSYLSKIYFNYKILLFLKLIKFKRIFTREYRFNWLVQMYFFHHCVPQSTFLKANYHYWFLGSGDVKFLSNSAH